jgi:hypothetical protein
MVPAIIEIWARSLLEPLTYRIDFAELPRVGDGLEVDLAMLGNPEYFRGHPAVVAYGGRFGISLKVRSMYWQSQIDGSSQPFMIPVLGLELIESERTDG